MPRRELQRALASKPSAELYSELGLAEGQLGNLTGAQHEFRHAIQLNPRLATAHLLLGVTLASAGDHVARLRNSAKRWLPIRMIREHNSILEKN